MKSIIFALIAVLFMAGISCATPSLQLDIGGGTYDTGTESVVAGGDLFTLYALLSSKSGLDPADDYYISASVAPKVEEQDGLDLGSFVFDGKTIAVTQDMTFGNAPLGQVENNADLPSHGVFDTYFSEFRFTFNTGLFSKNYDVQDSPGGLTPSAGKGSFLYYAEFEVDVSQLNPDYTIHFDLYSLNEDGTVAYFAPFSHDAESSFPEDGPLNPEPEPATILLFGVGLLAIARIVKKQSL